MTTFDKRDQGFENKFAHDEEMAFKAISRRNKLIGLWAAAKLGKKGADAEAYARDIVMFAVENKGKIEDKLHKDLKTVPVKEIHAEMERLLPVARKQIMGEEK